MKLAPDQKKFLEQLLLEDIGLMGRHPSIGCFSLEPEDIELYTEDPDQFAAERCGIDKEQLFGWQEFIKCWNCQGKNRNGSACKAIANNGMNIMHPENFVLTSEDMYCPNHKGQALEHKECEFE